MTTKEFLRIFVESGGELGDAMAELQDMKASEDEALRQSVGGNFTTWFNNLSPPVTTLTALESKIDEKLPTASTDDVSGISGNGVNFDATLNGTFQPRGLSLTIWFEYQHTDSTLSSPTQTSTQSASGSSSVAKTASLTGLDSTKTYYYRAVALYESGSGNDAVDNIFYGDIVPFRYGDTAQTIDFTDPGSKTYGSTFTISATSKDGSNVATGLTVQFASIDTTICTVGNSSISANVSSATVTPVTVGTCKIKATQAGGGSSPAYKAAPAITKDITISTKGVTIASGVSATHKEFNDNDSATVSCSSPTASGVESGDSSYVSVNCSSPSGTFASKNVANGISVTVSGVSLTGGRSNRYSLTVSGVTANITVKGLVVTAGNKSKTVGDPDPTWTVSGAGLQGSDSLNNSTTTYTFAGTGSTTYASSTTPPSAVGTYSITPSSAGFTTGSASNYNISYTAGTYEILALGAATTSTPATTAAPAVTTTSPTTTSSLVPSATTSTTTTAVSRRITICHRTMAGTFVEITVDRNSLGGHGQHGTDIIPAPVGGCGVLTQSNEPEPEPSGESTSTTAVSRRITICHRTMAGTFVEITVDRNSLGGHGQHGTDIIPAPEGGCGQESVNELLATTTTLARGRITICHRTMAGTFVEITVDRNSLGGHDNHGTDIIPAPLGGCDVLGTPQNGGGGGNTTSAQPRRITICHWNASDSYVEITVDANGLNGHGDHENDIIPAPDAGCGRSSVQRALQSTTTTTDAPGSLQDTKEKLDDERKGGNDKTVLDVVNLDSNPKPGGGGGTIELDPKKDGPGVQLLDVKTNDPNVQLDVKSSGSDYNKPQTWVNEGFGTFCWKLEPFNGEYSYTLPNPPNPPDAKYAGLAYSAVIVKAGSVVESDPNYQANTVFMNPAPGSVVWPDVNKNGILDPGGQGGGTLGDKAISHIVICVGESEYPEILTTTTTTIPSGTTTTTLAGATTTVVGSTTSAPLRTTTTLRPTTTTLRSTTTTVRPTTTVQQSIQQSTTTVRPTTTTLRSTTTTVRPTSTTVRPTTTTLRPTTTTAGSTATTQPASPTTTVPGDTQPPIVIDVTPPPDGFTKQAVVVELLVSTGSQTETVFLEVDLQNFSVKQPQQVLVLPGTGVNATGSRGVLTQAFVGLAALILGLAAVAAGRTRRRA